MYLNEKFMHYLVKSIICNDWIFLDDGAKFSNRERETGRGHIKRCTDADELKKAVGED